LSTTRNADQRPGESLLHHVVHQQSNHRPLYTLLLQFCSCFQKPGHHVTWIWRYHGSICGRGPSMSPPAIQSTGATIRLKYWWSRSMGQTDHAFGHEYTKGCIQIGFTLGSILGSRPSIKKMSSITSWVSQGVAPTFHPLSHLQKWNVWGMDCRKLPWLFWCLMDDEFAPRKTIQAPLDKPRSESTVKENTACLKVRGKKVPQQTRLPQS
jgi:hypothetical protein